MGRAVHFGDQIEWDADKAAENPSKHRGVTFEEGSTVFEDRLARFTYDFDHSQEEDRFAVIGQSRDHRMLVVSYTLREERVRIISAREAEKSEAKSYANVEKT